MQYYQCGVVNLPSSINCTVFNDSVFRDSFNQEDDSELQSKIIGLYIIGSLCLFGIIGNLLSVIGLRKDKERKETLFLLQCLAVIDGLYLLTALFKFPLQHLVERSTYFYIQLGVFPLLKSFQTICIWTMVLVTIDRYIYVCHPLRAQLLFTRKTRRIWAVATIVTGLLYNLPRFFDSCITIYILPCTDVYYGGMMFRPPFNESMYSLIYRQVLYIIFLYAAPLSILTFMNWRLIKAIKRSRRRHANCVHSTHPQDPTHDNNATVVLVIVVIAFIVCEAPEPVLHIISVIEQTFDVRFNVFNVLSTVSNILMIINSSINFLIYLIFGRRFRGILKLMLHQNITAATSIFTRNTTRQGNGNTLRNFPKIHYMGQPCPEVKV